MARARKVCLFVTLLAVMVLSLGSSAWAASISGTVNYTGSKAGRIYISAPTASNSDSSYGTSIAGSGSSFTIHGVAPGTYTLKAYMDTIGNGNQAASSPVGVVSNLSVQDGVVNANITLTDPPLGSAQTPTNLSVSPGSGAAFIMWESFANNGVATADSHSIYWSANPDFTPATATGSKLDIPVDQDDFFIQKGISNGTVLYYLITAKRGTNVSSASPIVGPITIGPPAGSTVSGTVSFSGFTPTGPLYVVVHDDADRGRMFLGAVNSPSALQSFTVPGVQNGTFFVHAIVDMNNNGVLDAGDIIYPNEKQNLMVTVNNGNATVPAITVTKVDAEASVRTNHYKSGGEGYNLNFNVRHMAKLPVSVSLVSGPAGISYPVDIGKSDGEFRFWMSSGRPALTDVYSLSVSYADGSSATLQAPVTGVIDTMPVPIGPTGNITGTTPTFSWSAPSPLPTGSYQYSLWLNSNSGNSSWYVDAMPSSQTSAVYNFNNDADESALSSGVTYNWGIQIEDAFGNQGSAGSSFTPQAPPVLQTGSASGTYSYDPASALLTMNWTTAAFPCNGPPVGTESATVASLSATTLTLVDDSKTWTRTGGISGNIVGAWTFSDSIKNKFYNLGFNADGTLVLTGTVSCSDSSDTQAPTVPTGVHANSMGTSQVYLSWSASTDNVGVAFYKVYRNGTPAGQPSGQNSNFWQDTGLAAGTYSYTVSACDQANNCSSPSFSSQATILPPEGQAGAASATYTYVPGTGGGTLSWNWTSTTFPCDKGPSLGAESIAIASLTATAMTWVNDNMTWTRSSGTSGNIVGSWSSTDGSTNNSYNLTFNATGSVSLTGTVHSCGDGGGTASPSLVVPQASIQVDGNVQDWSGITPILTDPSGDTDYTGLDITGISMAQDGQNIYFRADRAGNNLPSAGYSNFWFYLRPASPGMKGYAVEFFHTSPTQYEARLWDISANPNDYNSYVRLSSNVTNAIGTTAIEFAIPKSSIIVGNSFNLSFFTHHTDANFVWQSAGEDTPANSQTVVFNSISTPGPGSASGTYSYNPVSGLLSLDWTSVTFPCNKGPALGADTPHITSLTETQMVWTWDGPDSHSLTWTRTSGTNGSILGAWSAIDSGSSQNSFNAVFNPDGTTYMTGTIYSCGGSSSGDTQAPTVPTGVYAAPVSATQVNLLWNPSSDNFGVTYYKIYRNGSLAGQPAGQSNNLWQDNALVPGTYTYAVSACDQANNCSAPSSSARATLFGSGGQGALASGTYTYAPGLISWNFASTTFPCSGPSVGAETIAIASLTTNMMIWADDNMAWTRSAGASDSILGTWNSLNSTTNNSYNLTFYANGTVSVTGTLYSCAGGSGDSGSSTPAPLINSFSPASGPVGSLVAINGSNFDSVAANNSVKFNGVAAKVTEVHPGQLFVTVPAGATTGPVSVNNSGGTVDSAQSFTVNAGLSGATLSWGRVYHRINPDGSEYDALDAGVNGYAGTLSGMTLTVTKPDGSVYSFTDNDITPYIKGQLAVYKQYQTNGAAPAPLAPGVYTFTLNDGWGHLSHAVATYAAVTKLPLVDSATIQYQRKADGSYRLSWAPVNDARTNYYRLRIALDDSASSTVYDSQRDMVSFADVPAGIMFDGARYKARVEVFDAPNGYINRSVSSFKTFTPNGSDYNPSRLLVNNVNLYNRAVTDTTFVTVASLGVSDITAVTLVELTGPNSYKSTFNMTPKSGTSQPTDSTSYTVTGLAGSQIITDFFKEFTAPLTPGAYTYHFVANGIDHYAYVTLSAPVAYPAPDPATCQAEDLGNGSIRFSWANVDNGEALYYRVTVNDKVTTLNYNSSRKNQAFVDIPKAALGSNAQQWRVEVHDSANLNTLRNRRNGAWVAFAPIAYDPARPVINSFRLRNLTKSSGVNYTHVGVNAGAAQSTLAQIMVTGPGGYSRDLLAAGRYSSDFGSYLLEEAGAPAPGLYTMTVKDSAGKTAVRYVYHSAAALPVLPVDFRTMRADLELNGDLRLSWAPVISNVPLWYQLQVYATGDLNGDGLIDRVYVPYILKDTNGDGVLDHVTMLQQASLIIPSADLATIPDPALYLIRTFDGSDPTVISNYSQSVMAGGGSQTLGLDYATLADADHDGYASNADGNDANAAVYPFSAAVASPAVVLPSPAAGSSNVPVGTVIGATFNKVIDQRTLPGNITVTNGVTGAISYNPVTRVASFVPSAPLAAGATYTVTIGTGVKDEAGTPLAAPFSWSFSSAGIGMTLGFNGNGHGQVNGNMTCSSGSICPPKQFPQGAVITLLASPDGNSLFAGWSGACDGLGNCTVTLNAAKSVTATFTNVKPVKVNGKAFNLLQDAYNDVATVSGNTIKVRDLSLTENLIFDRSITVTLRGGYDTSFQTSNGETAVRGKVMIRNGRLNANKLAVW